MSIFYETHLTQEQRQTLSGWQDIVKVEAGIRSPFWEGGAWREKAEPIVAGIRRDGGVIALNPTMKPGSEQLAGDKGHCCRRWIYSWFKPKNGRVMALASAKALWPATWPYGLT